MILKFTTRQQARSFHAKRIANNMPSKLLDNGPAFKPDNVRRSRYAVSLKG